jgi:hydroxymethylpyrimidine pyrophosphatase-like HAD family hydrolase
MEINAKNIKLIAMDLDGTLTQHKEALLPSHRAVLDRLAERYRLLMVGAGQVRRIFHQLGQYPIDIIGNYGLQYAVYDKALGDIRIVEDISLPQGDRASIEERVTFLREKHGFTEFKGDSVEYHPSGCVTFAVLGTKADQADKLSFDPDRKKRRAFYAEVKALFPEYRVFIGGSSSFDMAPAPYDKRHALAKYCEQNGILPSEVLFIGDDYGEGGNDESVYLSDFNFLTIDDYRTFPEITKFLLD